MVVIVDLGLGNLLSVKRAVEHVGGSVIVTDDANIISQAKKIILPGVGSFQAGMKTITGKGLASSLKYSADIGVPMLGICLGMQLLMGSSSEHGYCEGLDIIPGKVKYIGNMKGFEEGCKVPHIGWNRLRQNIAGGVWESSILQGLSEMDSCYFVHSYCVVPDEMECVQSFSEYAGCNFVSSVKYNNVVGCQFHPEKSGEVGLKIVNHFIHEFF